MKNTKFKYLVILVTMVLTSCGKKQNLEGQPFLNEKLNAVSSRVAQEYSKNGAEINLSPNSFLYTDYKNLKDEDKGKIRAVTYRFYKHVKVENGKLNIDINNGSEINISEPLFNTLYKNLNQTNRFLDSLNQKGVKIELPIITEDYLNSLISIKSQTKAY